MQNYRYVFKRKIAVERKKNSKFEQVTLKNFLYIKCYENEAP